MIRFIFKGTDEELCLSHLKELRIRSHVLVGLGRIYAEHLHEMFVESPGAQTLLNRAENIARYEANVQKLYPEKIFGEPEGGLCKEIKKAMDEAIKEKERTTQR